MSAIVFEKVSKSYEQGGNLVHALHEVSLAVNAGEFIAIVGPSGSGKSTFLSIAGALLSASQGNVILNQKNLNQLSAKELSNVRLHDIGFIFQHSHLVPYLKVIDQLLVIKRMNGKVKSSDAAFAIELLESLGLKQHQNKMPGQLSGGERQRVAIARAFMNDPSVILADEPTASLDTSRAHEVVKAIRTEVKNRNKAAIMVTHDERMLQYCDKVFVMEDGHLSMAK